MIRTAAQLIEHLGDPAAVAAQIGSSPTAVRMMKHRNKLPRTVWPELLDAYPDKVSLEVLRATESTQDKAAG